MRNGCTFGFVCAMFGKSEPCDHEDQYDQDDRSTWPAWRKLTQRKKPRMRHKRSLFPPSQCICLCHPSGDKAKDCPMCYEDLSHWLYPTDPKESTP